MNTTITEMPLAYPNSQYRDYAGRWRDQLVTTESGIECQHGISIDEACESCAWIVAGDDGE